MTTLRKKSPFRSISILASLIVIVGSGVCQGWWPYGWSYTGWGPGWFSRWSDVEQLPYYSLFPPVYYSHPVPRTYGSSPFASLPELASVRQVAPSEPLLVRNPYLRTESRTEVAADDPADQSLRVRNPFVDVGQKTDLDKCARIATLAPPSK